MFCLACPNGYYGQNCTRKCNVTCSGCNNVNGLCDSGCHPGWKGDYCQQRKKLHLFYQNGNEILLNRKIDFGHVKMSDLQKRKVN